ncbi:unnamed protein product [Penicillium pancosmium]
MGNISLEPAHLASVADNLDERQGDEDGNSSTITQDLALAKDYSLDPLSTNTMHYSGELSHWNFSKMLERRLQSLGNGTKPGRGEVTGDTGNGFFRATDLQSSGSCISLAKQYFPPRPIADFLVKTFLEYALTNYFYFDQDIFHRKLEYYYDLEGSLTINDAGWVCTLLMTFAIGTQFAYMQTGQNSTNEFTKADIEDDHIGIQLYRFCCRLIPDLITTASVESVQAFLLMGSYTLPIDTSGLAYTYYGLAIKMAIQNGMHRQFPGEDFDGRLVEARNRLWWSAYALESRISILHGRPASVSPAETDTPMPRELAGFQSSDYRSNLPNFSAAVILTKHLANASESIKSLRSCGRSKQQRYLRQLAAMRDQLGNWWSALPTQVHCRDLNQNGHLFRSNIHLEIYYITTIIYIGRPFIIAPVQGPENSTAQTNTTAQEVPDVIKKLRDDSLNAAIRGIELCQILQDSVGLARVSYTEFSACRIALLALIAHSLNEQTARISTALTQGMVIIRKMCVGLESAKSEVAVIEALDRARQRLYAPTTLEDNRPVQSASAYDQFQEWAKLWRADPMMETAAVSLGENAIPIEEQTNPSVPSFDGFFSSFPDELCEFTAIPGLNGDVSLGQEWLNSSLPDDIIWNTGGTFDMTGRTH